MKKLVIISLLASVIFSQQRSSYSWEDGIGTILGTFGYGTCNGVVDDANVGATSGINPYNGSRMLTISDNCLDENPDTYIAWVTNLSVGDEISSCFYGYDTTPYKPSLRIWGNWTDSNSDIDGYSGSASGNTEYTDDSGWSQICHTWTVTETEDIGLVIKARVYSEDNDLPQEFFIDLVEVTAPNNATIIYPGGSDGLTGCMNATACNYNPFASEDDGSCFYPQGSISIYDIQYTSDQGQYCYESVHDQECWTTSGTVTAVNPEYSNFYIQDTSSESYSGIYIHDMSPTPTLGQDITLTATVNEYYSLTQLIDGTSFTVNSTNSVEPTDITTGDLLGCTAEGESVESMLVRISNVAVTMASNEFGEWYVDDGSGAVMINDKIFDGEWPDPSSGQEFGSIVGVVDYAYSEFSILPRTMSDIVLCPTCPVADAGDDQLVPPGTVEVTLDGSGSYDPNGNIISYEWTQLSGEPVDLSDEEAVSTTFTAPNILGNLIFRLTIYDNDFVDSSDEVIITVGYGTPIQDIQCQDGMDQGTYCYETPLSGDNVTTYGIVTHVLAAGHSSEGNFFLQQPGVNTCGGIFIRDFDIVPNVGDELTLSGTVNEYYSFTQLIDITSSSINSTGNSTSPMPISTADLGIACSLEGEYLEGMLVEINNILVENIDEFGNIQVNDGSGPTLIDDYYFDGSWNISIGDFFSSIVGVVAYSYSEFKIYPRDEDDLGGCSQIGDLNGDGNWNVLDIVSLANCILAQNCGDLTNSCASDLNDDGNYNVLDIVTLANCILDQNCGGRIEDATKSSLIMKDNHIYIEADGFIGGIQMTLKHDDDFKIEMTDRALFADYLTYGNETRLLVITPETDELFSFSGDFKIAEIIVANSQHEISVDIPLVNGFRLNEAYPNPFNPITSLIFNLPEAGSVTVQVYNLQGQVINTLLSGYQVADTYNLTWDASHAPSGIYFVKAESAKYIQTRKLMLIK